LFSLSLSGVVSPSLCFLCDEIEKREELSREKTRRDRESKQKKRKERRGRSLTLSLNERK